MSKRNISPPLLRPSPLPDFGSLGELSDDVILHTLSFFPCVRSLANFALTSKRAFYLVFDSPVSDRFFETLYQESYGRDGNCLNGGKELYKSMFRLRECLKWGMLQPQETSLKTLGVVSAAEEAEAIFYDNPSYGADQQYCIGYFGWHSLSEKGPVLVWGDFNGVRVAPCLDAVLDESAGENHVKPQTSQAPNPGKNNFRAIGDRNGGFQVLTVLQSPKSANGDTSFFLGFASGMVTAVTVTASPEGKQVYSTTSTTSVHSSEVTGLAFLPVDNNCLLSCSVDGNVYLYPDSARGSLDNARLACSLSKAIFSISTVKWNHTHMLLCTGDPEGKVVLRYSALVSKVDAEDICQFDTCNDVYSSTSSYGENILVTQLRFLHNDSKVLVSATNTGEIRLWDVLKVSVKQPWGESVSEPRLKLRHAIGMAHRGTIETIKVVGNILLTSGGDGGYIKGWDIGTGTLLGGVAVHPGRYYPPEPHPRRKALKSAVVDTLVRHDRETLVSLCRDGAVHEWSYGEEDYKKIIQLAAHSRNRAHKRRRGDSNRCLEHWESQRESAFVLSSSLIADRKRQMLEDIGQITGASIRGKGKKSPFSQMQKSIIHAAFRHCIETPKDCNLPCPFIGADNNVYGDIKTAFNHFSGLDPCRQCQAAGSEAYDCRLRNKHDETGDNPEESTSLMSFMRNLMRSKKVAPGRPPSKKVSAPAPKSGDCWICERCQFENKPDRARCAECFRSRGKEHQHDASQDMPSLVLSSSNEGTETHEASSTDSDGGRGGKKSAQQDGAAPGTVRIWECFKCAYRNEYRKYKCGGCGRRVGGPIMDVESNSALGAILNDIGEKGDGKRIDSTLSARDTGGLLANGGSVEHRHMPTAVPMKELATPHANDVLFGRGHHLNHDGNKKFRALVSHQQVLYYHASRDEGNFISHGVVRAIRSQLPPGRFLQKNESTGLWHDVGDAAAATKAHKSLWEVRRAKNRRHTSCHSETHQTNDGVDDTSVAHESIEDTEDNLYGDVLDDDDQIPDSLARCTAPIKSEPSATRSASLAGNAMAEEDEIGRAEEWECDYCTLVNSIKNVSCEVCGEKRKRTRRRNKRLRK